MTLKFSKVSHVALVSAAVIALGGCGIGGAIKDAQSALNGGGSSGGGSSGGGSSGGGSSGGGSTTAQTGNAYFAKVDVKTGAVTQLSSPTGSKMVVTAGTAWTEVSALPADINNSPEPMIDFQGNVIPGQKIYKRSVTMTASDGLSSTLTADQYAYSTCQPGTTGCGRDPGIEAQAGTYTQSGKAITKETLVAGPDSPLITIKEKWGYSNRTGQYSYAGEYSDSDLKLRATALNGDDDPTISMESGTTSGGVFFGGEATSSTDMAALKASNVTATYSGHFSGTAGNGTGQSGSVDRPLGSNAADIQGQTQIMANFGASTVQGSVYGLQRWDDNAVDAQHPDGQPTAVGYGIAMDGTITGATYAGTAKYTAAATVPGAAALSSSPTGNMIGGFYGPNAAETAGAIRIIGQGPGTGPGTASAPTGVLMGAFGGAKAGPAN